MVTIPFGTANKFGFFMVGTVGTFDKPVGGGASLKDGELLAGMHLWFLWTFLYVRVDKLLPRHMYLVVDSFLSHSTAQNYLPYSQPLNKLQALWLGLTVWVETRGKARLMRGREFFDTYPELFEC